MDERLIRIEEKIAHLERAVETLDEVVREAFEALAELRRDVERMGENTRRRLDGLVEALDEGDVPREEDTPPA